MAEKFTVEAARAQGVPVLEARPYGWKLVEGAMTAPKGYHWYCNGGHRFEGTYEHALVKDAKEV